MKQVPSSDSGVNQGIPEGLASRLKDAFPIATDEEVAAALERAVQQSGGSENEVEIESYARVDLSRVLGFGG